MQSSGRLVSQYRSQAAYRPRRIISSAIIPASSGEAFKHAIPADLNGKSVLDIGCNGGFYSIEMKRRGADRVVGIDSDEDYLAQARFAAEGQRDRYRVPQDERLRSSAA